MKKLLLVLLTLLAGTVLLVGMILVFSPDEEPSQTNDRVNQQQSSHSDSPKLLIGDPSAPVTIIEYIDFKCSQCYRLLTTIMPSLQKDYIDTGKVNIEIRTIPYIGLDARPAAEGAYCAEDQNRFREYHDEAFEYIHTNYYQTGRTTGDEVFTNEALIEIAAKSELNAEEFMQCIENNEQAEAVDADLAASRTENITGTPTFVIGGRKIVGNQPYQVYRSLIEAQLR